MFWIMNGVWDWDGEIVLSYVHICSAFCVYEACVLLFFSLVIDSWICRPIGYIQWHANILKNWINTQINCLLLVRTHQLFQSWCYSWTQVPSMVSELKFLTRPCNSWSYQTWILLIVYNKAFWHSHVTGICFYPVDTMDCYTTSTTWTGTCMVDTTHPTQSLVKKHHSTVLNDLRTQHGRQLGDNAFNWLRVIDGHFLPSDKVL